MANRWGNSRNSDRLYFRGSKITVDGDCNHEIKRRLLLGRKVITNLDSIFKSIDITVPTKVQLVKAIGEGNGTPLQYSCLENPMHGGALLVTVHGVARSQTWQGDFASLLLGRKVMTNLDSILKSRDIILSTKVHLVKAMVFPVVTYGYESWTIKKAEHRRIDAFELWCRRKLLRVPWTARRSN